MDVHVGQIERITGEISLTYKGNVSLVPSLQFFFNACFKSERILPDVSSTTPRHPRHAFHGVCMELVVSTSSGLGAEERCAGDLLLFDAPSRMQGGDDAGSTAVMAEGDVKKRRGRPPTVGPNRNATRRKLDSHLNTEEDNNFMRGYVKHFRRPPTSNNPNNPKKPRKPSTRRASTASLGGMASLDKDNSVAPPSTLSNTCEYVAAPPPPSPSPPPPGPPTPPYVNDLQFDPFLPPSSPRVTRSPSICEMDLEHFHMDAFDSFDSMENPPNLDKYYIPDARYGCATPPSTNASAPANFDFAPATYTKVSAPTRFDLDAFTSTNASAPAHVASMKFSAPARSAFAPFTSTAYKQVSIAPVTTSTYSSVEGTNSAVKHTGSRSSSTRSYSSRTSEAAKKKIEDTESIKEMIDNAARPMLKYVSLKLFAEMMNEFMNEINPRCGTFCHPGAVCSNGGACAGKMSISHEICPKTRMDESDVECEFVESFFVKEDGLKVRRVKCKHDTIDAGRTLFKYVGVIMSSEDFEKLPADNAYESARKSARKKLSLKAPEGHLVVPEVVARTKSNKRWEPCPKNYGASIVAGTAENYNVEVVETADKSFVVVTTKMIVRGEQLFYPPLQRSAESEDDSDSSSESSSSSSSESPSESESSSDNESEDSSDEE